MVTKEEWVNWKNSACTQQYLKNLHNKREDLKDGLAEGQTSTEREDCIIIGRTQGIKDAILFAVKDFDYIQLEDDNGTESGSVPSNSEG